MGVLGLDLASAVRWVAERFAVPTVKVGRPEGSTAEPKPYRTGTSGSEWEVIVRSGAWGLMTTAERSVLVVLDAFKDSQSGVAVLSYRAIMRYGGIGKPASVSAAIKSLARIHALQVSPGQRIGITRACNGYRTTLTDAKFLETCNKVAAASRDEIAADREYRAQQKCDRERSAPKPSRASLQVVKLNTNQEGGFHPPVPPGVCTSNSNPSEQPQEKPLTCKGLNLSSPREVHANKPLPPGNRLIAEKLERDKAVLRERGFLP
jgi:hypothetical protein